MMDEGFVEARSDNLPRVDAFMLMQFASTCEDFISAEIRNVKSDRSMRESESAVGKVCLRRYRDICTKKRRGLP